MADRETLEVYREKAGDYANMMAGETANVYLEAFIAALPEGGRALDLGCGPGKALVAMTAAGLRAEGLDASPEFANMARSTADVPVTLGGFEALQDSAAFDGIYANFSLLHAPKAEMPDHLARIARALSPGGVFHIGMKTGSGEKRDALGRFYAYYTEAELTGFLNDAGFTILSTATGEDTGLDGTVAPWIILLTRKAT